MCYRLSTTGDAVKDVQDRLKTALANSGVWPAKVPDIPKHKGTAVWRAINAILACSRASCRLSDSADRNGPAFAAKPSGTFAKTPPPSSAENIGNAGEARSRVGGTGVSKEGRLGAMGAMGEDASKRGKLVVLA